MYIQKGYTQNELNTSPHSNAQRKSNRTKPNSNTNTHTQISINRISAIVCITVCVCVCSVHTLILSISVFVYGKWFLCVILSHNIVTLYCISIYTQHLSTLARSLEHTVCWKKHIIRWSCIFCHISLSSFTDALYKFWMYQLFISLYYFFFFFFFFFICFFVVVRFSVFNECLWSFV